MVLAEVELQHANQKFDLPGWVGEEVTGDPRYRKINMLTQRIVDLRESQAADAATPATPNTSFPHGLVWHRAKSEGNGHM